MQENRRLDFVLIEWVRFAWVVMPFYGKSREGSKALNSKRKQRINSLHFRRCTVILHLNEIGT